MTKSNKCFLSAIKTRLIQKEDREVENDKRRQTLQEL